CTFSVSTATATIAAGRPATGATCTFYNKLLPAPVVTVGKACSTKAASTDRFAVVLNGTATGDVLDCGGSAQVQVTPGQPFTFTEVGAGTPAADLANYSIGYSAGCTGTLINGQTGSCTITNTLEAAPVVTVTKSCPNGKAATGDRFQVKSNGTEVGSPLDCGTSLGVLPGPGVAYTITEGAAGTTDLSNYETPVYSAGCSGALAHFGDTATCTITNTLKTQPVVHVTKTCATEKAAPGDLFQVKLNGGNVGSALDCGGALD